MFHLLYRMYLIKRHIELFEVGEIINSQLHDCYIVGGEIHERYCLALYKTNISEFVLLEAYSLHCQIIVDVEE